MNVEKTTWSPTPTAQEAPKNTMDSQAFLRLLMTQMSQQDPLNPTDSTQFVAQLTQFSNLEQLVQLNTQMNTLAMSQSASTSTAVASLIGRTITASGNSVELGAEAGADVTYNFPAAVKNAEMVISDSSGRVIRTVGLGEQKEGKSSYAWDGKDNDGNRCEAGAYTYSVKGEGALGQSVSATGRLSGTVTAISYDKGFPELLVGTQRITLGDVIEVS